MSGRTAARRDRTAGPLLLAALLLAGCGGDVRSPIAERASDAGTAEPARVTDPAEATAAGGPSTPSPSDPLTGSFRRGGVPVPPAVLAEVVSACRAVPTPPYAEEIGSRPVAVSDLRGEGIVIVVFAGPGGATGCRVRIGTDPPVAALFAVDAGGDGALDEGQITLGSYELDEDGSSRRTIAVGRYGDRVVKVRAGFDDDTYVTASTDNGWYAMWWQGSVRPAVIVAADNRNLAMGKLTPPTGAAAP
jgi:hypothetical protein